jgi:hypothetical protein
MRAGLVDPGGEAQTRTARHEGRWAAGLGLAALAAILALRAFVETL